VISQIEDYFSQGCGRCSRFATPECSSQIWAPGLQALRQICLDTGLVETLKWGHPCYTHQGRNLAIIGAFRGDFRLTFFNASLLKDAKKVLQRKGPNTLHADILSFTDAVEVKKMQATIRAYLQEAMALAEAGVKPAKVVHELQLPPELIEALKQDKELDDAFHQLTLGRQRSYVIHLSTAKKSETRVARIKGFREKIMSGKGAMER
jgi:uncharacterized protein YdeI (YjbR/CyaY-like superfamily)